MALKTEYQKIAEWSKETVVEAFNLSKDGLSDNEVKKRREKNRLNKFKSHQITSYVKEFLYLLATPMTLVLLLIALVSYFSDYMMASSKEKSLATVIVILFIIFIKVIISLYQTLRSQKLTAIANEEIVNTCLVLRQGEYQAIPFAELVYGDIIQLYAGDIVPADIRIISSKNLNVSQMLLTGNSKNVPKSSMKTANQTQLEDITEYNTLAFKGSSVVNGFGEGVVIATGEETLFAKTHHEMHQQAKVNKLDAKIQDLSKWLLQKVWIIAPLVVLISGMATGEWFKAVVFGLAVVVVATPEFFPMGAASSFFNLRRTLQKEGVFIKKRQIIPTLSSIDVYILDGTDVLTMDHLHIHEMLNPIGESSEDFLKFAYLNSYMHTGRNSRMDDCIIEKGAELFEAESLNYEWVSELPFDTTTKVRTVIIDDTQLQRHTISQGDVKEIVNLCSWIAFNGERRKLTKKWSQAFNEQIDTLNSEGYRVIGVAEKTTSSLASEVNLNDNADFVFVGYFIFALPVHERAKLLMEATKTFDVEVRLFTQDHHSIARLKMEELGYEKARIITGDQIALLNPPQLAEIVNTYDVYAQMNTEQKVRIIKALQENGRYVAYLGEEANDVVNIAVANVGIATYDAADVVREHADIILKDNDLMHLEELLSSGRKIYVNIMKYIQMISSYYFGTMLAILMASFFLPFVPMNPIQLLVLNFVISIGMASLHLSSVTKEEMIHPTRWSSQTMKQRIVKYGVARFICDAVFFVLLYWTILPRIMGTSYYNLGLEEQHHFENLFHSGWFIMSLWSQLLSFYILPVSKASFFNVKELLKCWLFPLLGIGLGTMLSYTVLGQYLELVSIPDGYWPGFLAYVGGYLILVVVLKLISRKD